MRFFIFVFFMVFANPLIAGEIISGRASVIDGDTIDIHGSRIRIWGIDAPESNQLCSNANGQDYLCGQKASLALADWLNKSQPIQCEIQYKDKYERFVAKCMRADKQDIGKYMVGKGFALDWPRYSKGYYNKVQESTKQKKIGMWQGHFIEPWQWRWNNKSNKIN